MSLPKFMNNLVKSAKKLCNPLQLYVLTATVLFLFELYEANFEPNVENMGIQALVTAVTGGLIFKLCADGDMNLAYLTLGLYLSFWFLQKSMILDQYLAPSKNEGNGYWNEAVNANTNKKNVNTNKNVNANKNVGANNTSNAVRNHAHIMDRINYANGPWNVKGERGNGYMNNAKNGPMNANVNQNWQQVQKNMGVALNAVPVAANDNASTNNNAAANFNNSKPRNGLNGNIPTKGNAVQNNNKNANAYNAVGAFAGAGKLGNLSDYYQKRASWINQVDLSMPDGPARAPHAESNAPCVIQQHDKRSVFETPSNKLRNYGINTRTHQRHYRLGHEDHNKVQTGYDAHMPTYSSTD